LTVSNFSAFYALFVTDGATATLAGCKFIGNSVHDSVLFVFAFGTYVTVVRLKRCTFTGNAAGNLLTSRYQDAYIYVDEATLKVIKSSDSTADSKTEPLSAAPADRPGLTALSDWYLFARQVCSSSACLLHTSGQAIGMQPCMHAQVSLSGWKHLLQLTCAADHFCDHFCGLRCRAMLGFAN
jgi:hypothetical protein